MGQDLVNSTWRTIYLDQAGLGLSREYLVKGVENERVQHYFGYMKTVSALHYLVWGKKCFQKQQILSFDIVVKSKTFCLWNLYCPQ